MITWFKNLILPPWLQWGLKHKALIGLAVSVGLLSYMTWLADKRGEKVDELTKAVSGYQQVVIDMRAWHDNTVDALEEKVEHTNDRNEFERQRTLENAQDRVAGDGPLSPVLHRGLDRLRERQAAYRNRNPR